MFQYKIRLRGKGWQCFCSPPSWKKTKNTKRPHLSRRHVRTTAMPESAAARGRCFDCKHPPCGEESAAIWQTAKEAARLRNADCMSMLLNGLIYRHRWFTMCTGKKPRAASLIYHLKRTPGCWYAKRCRVPWLLLPLKRNLQHNRFGDSESNTLLEGSLCTPLKLKLYSKWPWEKYPRRHRAKCGYLFYLYL